MASPREFKDERLAKLWKALLAECPKLTHWELTERFECELEFLQVRDPNALDRTDALRSVAGLAIVSRSWERMSVNDQKLVFDRIRRESVVGWRPEKVTSLVWELQVFARLASANLRPEFVPTKKGERRPDIRIESRQTYIECKNLLSRDFRVANINGMCAQVRKHARKAASQFESIDPETKWGRIMCLHLPFDPRGFFRGRDLGDRVRVSLAASGSVDEGDSGRPGDLNVMLVESSLTRLYDRPGELREPMEYWHVASCPYFKSAAARRTAWDVLMSMNVCPFEEHSMPMRMVMAYQWDQSTESRKEMDPERAMELWEAWNARTGTRFDVYEMPPMAMFPSMAKSIDAKPE